MQIGISFWLSFTTAVLAGSVNADDVDAANQRSPSFRHDVMAVLSRAGCNMGTCHGNAHGKGGLKLSLRGQDPRADYLTLTRELGARRVSPLAPDDSLLLRKPTMRVPHQGGRRFGDDSRQFRILRDWIASGMADDRRGGPRLVNLSVSPSHATIYAPDNSVQLRVTATFSNESQRDVTHLTVFESSALFVSISDRAVAEADHAGQTTITARYLDQQVPVRLEFVPERPGFVSKLPQPTNFIDEAVFRQLKRLKINPSEICSDEVFLRRAYLDLTGLLPGVERAKFFIGSADPNKRAKLIDELLDSAAFNDMQALRWSDLLRVEVKTLDEKGVEVFHDWIRSSFAQRKPLNEFAAEIIAARGSTYKVPATNFYRALRKPELRAEATAQMFLGIRLQCAKCHNHPFDRWTQDDYYGWTNFFARIDYKIIENKRRDKNDKHEFTGEQIVLIKTNGDINNPRTRKPAALRFLGDGSDAKTEGGKKLDRLQRLAKWLGSPANDPFAATQANRIWFQLLGRGIVDPIDDFRSTNPPTNPALLAALQREFVASQFDVRYLMRIIMNSNVYQLSSVPNETNVDGVTVFARAEPQRLTAEQTLDAITQVLGVPAQFGGYGLGMKAVQLAGVRNGGHRYSPPAIGDRFLRLFGKPNRLMSCECERSAETTLAQTFELCGGDLIDQLLRSPDGRIPIAIKRGDSDTQVIERLYWSALCRAPTERERKFSEQYVARGVDRRSGLQDVAWAILNSNEFLLRR